MKGSKAAKRTDDLLAVAAMEFEMQDFGPRMIVGDIIGTWSISRPSKI